MAKGGVCVSYSNLGSSGSERIWSPSGRLSPLRRRGFATTTYNIAEANTKAKVVQSILYPAAIWNTGPITGLGSEME
jgi:hypothetical protein